MQSGRSRPTLYTLPYLRLKHMNFLFGLESIVDVRCTFFVLLLCMQCMYDMYVFLSFFAVVVVVVIVVIVVYSIIGICNCIYTKYG